MTQLIGIKVIIFKKVVMEKRLVRKQERKCP